MKKQAQHTLSRRKGTRSNRPTIPWACVIGIILLIQAFAFLFGFYVRTKEPPRNDQPKPVKLALDRAGEASVRDTLGKIIVDQPSGTSNKRKIGGAVSSHLRNDKRPDADLPENQVLRSLAAELGRGMGGNFQSCKWYKLENQPDGSSSGGGGKVPVVTHNEKCNQADQIVVYNTHQRERYVCGKLLKSGQSLKVDPNVCDVRLSSRVFERDPTLAKPQDMPEIHVSNGVAEGERNRFECNVPCVKIGGDGLIVDRNIEGTDWIIKYSMEGSGYYKELKVDPLAYKEDRYYATTSFQSEIPLPYFSWAEYDIVQPAVDYDKAIKGASFLATNCGSFSHRERVVRELIDMMRVDSLGKCMNNAAPPNGVGLGNKKLLQKQYLFHLAFENSNERDYVTEKLWGTLESGTLAVYLGAENIHDHAPPHSVISWHDFANTKALGEYLLKVAANKTLYESYHQWRKQPLAESFHRKFDFTNTHSICRICRWSYAKLYGFGWNQTYQTIQDLVLKRQFCHGQNGLQTHPFREEWNVDGSVVKADPAGTGACKVESIPPSVYDDGTGWSRTVWHHDGVTDIFVDTRHKETVSLRLATTMTDSVILHKSPRERLFQDGQTRLTVLTNWDSRVRLGDMGVVAIDIPPHQIDARLRIVVENIDTFHQDGANANYYFGDLMRKDFETPIETFVAVS